MDVCCGKENWNVVLVERNSKIIATLPFYKVKKRSLTLIMKPKLTQFMGIWIRYPQGQSYKKKLSFEKKIINELINKLPNFDDFKQSIQYTLTNWLPFYWNGFQQTTHYTYVIEDLTDLQKIYSNFKSSLINRIKKAEKIVTIKDDLTIEQFYEINKYAFKKSKRNIPYTYEFLKKLDEKCFKNKCRKILYAIDENGLIHSAIYLVWDVNSTYRLMSAYDPVFSKSGASALLGWKAIQFASTVSKRFDFEGSMLENIEERNRTFGAIQKPYFHLQKTNSNMLLTYRYIKSIFRK